MGNMFAAIELSEGMYFRKKMVSQSFWPDDLRDVWKKNALYQSTATLCKCMLHRIMGVSKEMREKPQRMQ